MQLYAEKTMEDTFEMALVLINNYAILEEAEYFLHFSSVIGSFSEIYDGFWDVDFTSLADVRILKAAINEYLQPTELDLRILRLVNRVIALMDPDGKVHVDGV